jgi:hypothetical protein
MTSVLDFGINTTSIKIQYVGGLYKYKSGGNLGRDY